MFASHMTRANERIQMFQDVLEHGRSPQGNTLLAGVDLGTSSIVTAVVDKNGEPVAGAFTASNTTIRDGLVLDYLGSIEILRRQMSTLRDAGYHVDKAAVAYPPGTLGKNAKAFAHVLEAVDLKVECMIDEPSAAATVLDIQSGAVVDIGGGTTGVSILENGEVMSTADEPSGGTHVDLVIAGHLKISLEEAENLKRDQRKQRELFPLVSPVFQKIATIVLDHIQGLCVNTLYLVGGTSAFPGIEKIFAQETGLEIVRPQSPLLVTPLGIALSLARTQNTSKLESHHSKQDRCIETE